MKVLPIYHIYRLVFRLSLALCVMLLTGCEVNNVDLTHAHNFVGEYIMETQIVAIYANNYVDTVPYVVESPVSIYTEGTNLYVQTNSFGIPNINGENPVEIEEDKTLTVISNEPDSQLEDIDVTSGASVMVKDGLVYTIRDGKIVKSNPILARKTLSDILKFRESKEFEIVLVDVSGTAFDECSLYFAYQPMYKKDRTLKWDINLIWKKNNSENPDYIKEIKYHNVLRKVE
ncbi:MAG: hypothetical protein J6C57_00325 [Paludibacteraceae bacterium]|nr:hypothetical protein [Paludibacteraceae bacterium]